MGREEAASATSRSLPEGQFSSLRAHLPQNLTKRKRNGIRPSCMTAVEEATRTDEGPGRRAAQHTSILSLPHQCERRTGLRAELPSRPQPASEEEGCAHLPRPLILLPQTCCTAFLPSISIPSKANSFLPLRLGAKKRLCPFFSL